MEEEVAAIFIFHSARARVQRVTQTSLLLCPLLVARLSGLLEKLLEDLRDYLVCEETEQELQIRPDDMALLCYNKGCGLKFDADKNADGESLRVSGSLWLEQIRVQVRCSVIGQ